MIHADGDVVTRAGFRMEHRVARQRADDVEPFRAQDLDRRANDVLVLATDRTPLARVRIEA